MVGRGRSSSRGGCGGKPQRGGLSSDAYFQSWQGKGSSRPHFSLNEEARYTEYRHTTKSDLRLRHSRVSFVSAGTSSAEELTRVPQGKSDDYSDVQAKKNGGAGFSGNGPTTGMITPEVSMSRMSLGDTIYTEMLESGAIQEPKNNLEPIAERGNPGTGDDIFFTDLQGSCERIHTIFQAPAIRRSTSPAASNSSDEIILFAGRNCYPTKPRKWANHIDQSRGSGERHEHEQSPSPGLLPQHVTDIIDDPIKLAPEILTSAQQHASLHHVKPIVSSPDVLRPDDISSGKLSKIPRGRRRGKIRSHQRQSNEEALILADYIANTDTSDHLDGFAESSGLNQRDLGVSDIAEWWEEVSKLEQPVYRPLNVSDEWDSTDLQDFDGISTSSEALDVVEQILMKRERPSGVQYLVIGQRAKVDDARWLPLDQLGVPGADEKIRRFEEAEAGFGRFLEGSDNSAERMTFNKQFTVEMPEIMDDLENKTDLETRSKARMTDEQIAILLTKQEELGLGSENVKLFDGVESDDEDELEAQLDGTREGMARSQHRSKLKRRKRDQHKFPSATTLADVLEQDPYNGFDVMDQDRPSLRKKPKGRRGKLPVELSDSDLEQQMQMVWENDRNKKKIRKQEREELRTQGLLGRKGKPDLKARYSEGMSVTQVKSEIKDFLLSSMQSVSLPPMAQRDRKMVHEIANVFKLKSKSLGSGTSRFPVLYKTSKTIRYEEDALGTVEALLSSGRFFPRMDKAKRRSAPTGKARGGGFAGAGVSYRDGEVVGATAPELGQENKGRAMLEKMGWSTGTALGALTNDRGIVQPVAQVVRTSKAGLG